jgi:hypothetical protein
LGGRKRGGKGKGKRKGKGKGNVTRGAVDYFKQGEGLRPFYKLAYFGVDVFVALEGGGGDGAGEDAGPEHGADEVVGDEVLGCGGEGALGGRRHVVGG